jgi:hypothetical protein
MAVDVFMTYFDAVIFPVCGILADLSPVRGKQRGAYPAPSGSYIS